MPQRFTRNRETLILLAASDTDDQLGLHCVVLWLGLLWHTVKSKVMSRIQTPGLSTHLQVTRGALALAFFSPHCRICNDSTYRHIAPHFTFFSKELGMSPFPIPGLPCPNPHLLALCNLNGTSSVAHKHKSRVSSSPATTNDKQSRRLPNARHFNALPQRNRQDGRPFSSILDNTDG